MASQTPQVGHWYIRKSDQAVFEVVALDDHSGTIEMQYDNGDLDEMDFDEWSVSQYTPSAEPEDALSAYGMGSDDLWDDDEHIDLAIAHSGSTRFDLDNFSEFDDF